ncbi:50S ribosomal protein L32 [Pirellulaceae bacterium SH449]
MAVPKRRHSNSRSGKRRAHHFKKPRQVMNCPKCGNVALTHHVCGKCGFYMGRNVVQMSDN